MPQHTNKNTIGNTDGVGDLAGELISVRGVFCRWHW